MIKLSGLLDASGTTTRPFIIQERTNAFDMITFLLPVSRFPVFLPGVGNSAPAIAGTPTEILTIHIVCGDVPYRMKRLGACETSYV